MLIITSIYFTIYVFLCNICITIYIYIHTLLQGKKVPSVNKDNVTSKCISQWRQCYKHMHQSMKAVTSICYFILTVISHLLIFEWVSQRAWDMARLAEQWARIQTSSGWGQASSLAYQDSSFYKHGVQWFLLIQIVKSIMRHSVHGIPNFI